MVEIFTVRIPRDIREKMRRYRHVNWSMVVREAILRKLKEIEEIEKKLRASEVMDKIRGEMLKNHGVCDYDSSEAIRSWRDMRRSS